MQVGVWRDKAFEVSDAAVRSFEKFTMSYEIETKTKTSGKNQYEALKKRKPLSITIDVMLHGLLGVDVEAEMLAWMILSNSGKGGKFFIGGRAMGTCNYVLTSVKATDVEFSPSGQMMAARVALTFKQSSKSSGSVRGARASSVVNVLRAAKAASKSLKKI